MRILENIVKVNFQVIIWIIRIILINIYANRFSEFKERKSKYPFGGQNNEIQCIQLPFSNPNLKGTRPLFQLQRDSDYRKYLKGIP